MSVWFGLWIGVGIVTVIWRCFCIQIEWVDGVSKEGTINSLEEVCRPTSEHLVVS